MSEIPPYSQLEVLGVPEPSGLFDIELYALNEIMSVSPHTVRASFRATSSGDDYRLARRLRRAFPDMHLGQPEYLPNSHISKDQVITRHLTITYQEKPETPVREAVRPFIESCRGMDRPAAHVFICYASEDKAQARDLSSAIAKLGAEVWLDEREISVGDSIVQRIEDGLSQASHLLVLLSENSVEKPWVRKELSSALMRQLAGKSITVLPIRLDNCTIPPILADIRYADARSGIERAIGDLEQALF